MTQRPTKVMINWGPMRLAVRSSLPVPFSEHGTPRAAPPGHSRMRRTHRRAAPHANGIWAQRPLFTRARMYADAGRPRNIIAVIRWNWGSLALTRVLGASSTPAAAKRQREASSPASAYVSPRYYVRVSLIFRSRITLEVSVHVKWTNESIRTRFPVTVSRSYAGELPVSLAPEALPECSISASSECVSNETELRGNYVRYCSRHLYLLFVDISHLLFYSIDMFCL